MRIVVDVPDELGERFRRAVAERKGYRRGALREAVCEALELWLDLGLRDLHARAAEALGFPDAKSLLAELDRRAEGTGTGQPSESSGG